MIDSLANVLQQGGIILWLILGCALVIFWKLSDLVFNAPCSGNRHCWQCRDARCRQLMVWVSATPLLGLLGTVNGLLKGFAVMGQNAPEMLGQSISQALLTTQAGLIIAAPAWVILMLLQHRCRIKLEQAL